MSYTRYNYNNNNNQRRRRGPRNNFFLVGLLICIPLAIMIGMIFGPMIFKNGDGGEKTADVKAPIANEDSKKKDTEEDKGTVPNDKKEEDKNTDEKVENYYIVQCGVYGKEDNAKGILDKIPDEYSKFISKEGDKFKVIAGIYNDEDSKEKAKALEEKEIVNVRIRSEIKQKDANSVKFSKIISGYMDILQKFDNNEVKSVKTEEFKKWVVDLKADSEKPEQESEEIKNLKEHIEKLPAELKREDRQKSSIFLYNMLNKHRV